MVEWEREAFWRAHVDACQQQAGLQRDYCREHGLSPRDLRKWQTRLHGPMRRRTSEVPVGAHAEAGLEEFSYARTEGSPPEAVAGMPVIRRRWTLDQKRQLVWEGPNSGMPLSRFARERGITPSAAYRWLREFANPVLASRPEASDPAFASVHVAAPAMEPVRQVGSHLAPEMVEIELADGRRLRVGPAVDLTFLRRLVQALEASA